LGLGTALTDFGREFHHRFGCWPYHEFLIASSDRQVLKKMFGRIT